VKLFEILAKNSPNKVATSMVFGLIAGISYSMLIPVILAALETPVNSLMRPIDEEPYQFLFVEVSQHKFGLFFLIICLCVLVFRSASQIILARVSMNATTDLRKTFYKRVSQLPIAQLETIGSSRLMAALTNDVPRIVQGASAIPDILISLLTIVGLLGFLVYLNLQVFYFISACIIFGILTYQIPIALGASFYRNSRKYVDALHESIKGLIWGAKELKLNEKKRKHFFEQSLHTNEDNILKNEKSGYSIMQVANNYGDLISFFVIGIVAFIIVNYQSIESADLVGIVMALLYLTGPIAGILNSIPMISVGKVSLERLNLLLEEMDIEKSHGITSKIRPEWDCVEVKDLCYRYAGRKDDAKSGFQLGPVNLTINKGEVTFIVGGNGSGKSTLGKLISLHYLPDDGYIAFNDQAVTVQNRNTFRQEVSAIYSDYYLFDRVFGINDDEIDQRISGYLEDFGLKEKVEIKNGLFSTTSLSDGQKRRLALIVSFLEERDLYIFDEWAADQDPSFKHIFYHQILNKLKNEGKAVVVVSHDDRYFEVADKIITMEAGKVLKTEIVKQIKTETESRIEALV
jgi:putative ATP-binding cassette transporter